MRKTNDSKGQTPLHVALLLKHAGSVKYLVDGGGCVEADVCAPVLLTLRKPLSRSHSFPHL